MDPEDRQTKSPSLIVIICCRNENGGQLGSLVIYDKPLAICIVVGMKPVQVGFYFKSSTKWFFAYGKNSDWIWSVIKFFASTLHINGHAYFVTVFSTFEHVKIPWLGSWLIAFWTRLSKFDFVVPLGFEIVDGYVLLMVPSGLH